MKNADIHQYIKSLRGGLTSFGPGELNWIPVNARKEGRIFFAGEHTSRWNGWMQGGIRWTTHDMWLMLLLALLMLLSAAAGGWLGYIYSD